MLLSHQCKQLLWTRDKRSARANTHPGKVLYVVLLEVTQDSFSYLVPINKAFNFLLFSAKTLPFTSSQFEWMDLLSVIIFSRSYIGACLIWVVYLHSKDQSQYTIFINEANVLLHTILIAYVRAFHVGILVFQPHLRFPSFVGISSCSRSKLPWTL